MLAGATVAGPLAFGDTTVNHNWKRVSFGRTFKDPVLVAKPFSSNGGQPGVIRIRNVNSTGFEIRIQEWSYLDGSHTQETVSFMAAERGLHVIRPGTINSSGALMKAGYFDTSSTDFVPVFFGTDDYSGLSAKPVVLASVVTYAGGEPVVGRIRSVTKTGFEYRLQEEEAKIQAHTKERVNYMAWEPSSGALVDDRVHVSYRAGWSSPIDHNFADISVPGISVNKSSFLADMQSTHGGDTASLRRRIVQRRNENGVLVDVIQLHVAEEQSADAETKHVKEDVGFVAVGEGTSNECPGGDCSTP